MNETIYYRSPLGILQLTNSGQAISQLIFVHKGHSNPVEETAFAFLPPTAAVLQHCVVQLDNYFAGKSTSFDIPLQQTGTAFQQTVWDALLQINYGQTESYLSLSKRIGNTKAIRAVGTANGRNNIAIIVPCHRVIGSNGSLVGYAGDLWRKQWLLQHEAKFAHGVQTLF